MGTKLDHQEKKAHVLAQELFKTTDRYQCEHLDITTGVILGAANIYLAAQYTLAPTKEIALKSLEDSFSIIRNMVQVLPDNYFGSNNTLSLN